LDLSWKKRIISWHLKKSSGNGECYIFCFLGISGWKEKREFF